MRETCRGAFSSPELLGIALFYLSALLHKLDVALHKVKPRLGVFVDDIILVLRKGKQIFDYK